MSFQQQRVKNIYNHIRRSSSPRKYGVWRATIENIDDPKRFGRVQARVWLVHGDSDQTPTPALPWADVCSSGGGGYDFGSYDPPPVGSKVFIEFEMGREDMPIVIGTFRGRPIRDERNPYEMLTKDSFTDTNGNRREGTWLPPEGRNEVPRDAFDWSADTDLHPTRRIWHKSYKGHTILIEERDGEEFLQIIDRAGQVIEMLCPVTEEANRGDPRETDESGNPTWSGNGRQRGVANALDGTQLLPEDMVDRNASIRIKDLAGQEIFMSARDGNEKIEIRSQSRAGSTKQRLILSSAQGREKIELVDKNDNRILIDTNSDTPIIIEDREGTRIKFDAETRTLVTEAQNETKEIAGVLTQSVRGNRESEVRGDDNNRVLGNKSTVVGADSVLSVAGILSGIIGSAVDITVTNTPASGPPAQTPINLSLTVAGVPLATFSVDLAGAITINSIQSAGLTALTTLDLSGVSGVNVSTAGQIDLAAVTGVRVGGAGGEPIILGAQFATEMAQLLASIVELMTAMALPLGPGNMGAPVTAVAWAASIGKLATVAGNMVSKLAIAPAGMLSATNTVTSGVV